MAAALLLASIAAFAPRASASTTVVVTPIAMDGWAISNGGTTATASLAEGPVGGPFPTGSASFTVGSDGDDGSQFRNGDYAGTPLGSLTALSYSTYVSANVNCQAVYIVLNIDNNGDSTTDDLLFFEPCYQTGGYGGDAVPDQCSGIPNCVDLNTWQVWDALAGGWWSLNAVTFGPPLTTLASYVGANPGATIVNSASGGGVRLVAGFGAGAWDEFLGNADGLTIGVGGTDVTYDFELEACTFTTTGTTMTLDGDCLTTATIFVPDGFTLDGAGYTITAYDPPAGHFLGAIIMNAGSEAHVTNLHLTTFSLANVCDGGADRLRGIMFDGASGSITNNVVVDINQGASGCQEGNGIEVRKFPFDRTHPATATVLIDGNTVTNYQKNGITVNGDVKAMVTNNAVTGAGPIDYIAQNGIQFGFGGSGEASRNAISYNNYTPPDTIACGLLFFESSGVRARMNVFFANERNVCNVKRGGGQSTV